MPFSVCVTCAKTAHWCVVNVYVRVNVLAADFGLAKEGVVHGHKGTGRFCDTAEYVAPEIINGTGYGTGVDWWALGMVLYEMLTGMMIYVWIAYPFILRTDCEMSMAKCGNNMPHTLGTPPWYLHDRNHKLLFKRIANEPLRFPRNVSPHARSIISGV